MNLKQVVPTWRMPGTIMSQTVHPGASFFTVTGVCFSQELIS